MGRTVALWTRARKKNARKTESEGEKERWRESEKTIYEKRTKNSAATAHWMYYHTNSEHRFTKCDGHFSNNKVDAEADMPCHGMACRLSSLRIMLYMYIATHQSGSFTIPIHSHALYIFQWIYLIGQFVAGFCCSLLLFRIHRSLSYMHWPPKTHFDVPIQ